MGGDTRMPMIIPGFRPPRSGFWLFAYGSLMWRPDIPFAERRHAVLEGYHRALCIYSWVYRGTEQKPGLVFGLDRGGFTKGVAYRIRARDVRLVLQRVYEREMVTNVYTPRWLKCRLADGVHRSVETMAFVANLCNPQYAGNLSETEVLRLVRQGQGSAGPCTDYVTNTLKHLRALGIRDSQLERIARKLG